MNPKSSLKVLKLIQQENLKPQEISRIYVGIVDALQNCLDYIRLNPTKKGIIAPKKEFYMDYIGKENPLLVEARFYKFA